jgi:nucleoside-diphosphate-sugar epimerase
MLDGLAELPPASGPAWHLATIVDLRDVAEAFALAVTCPDPGHVRLLLAADDIGSDRPTAQVIAEKLPQVPWLGAPLALDSRVGLVSSARAKQILGWAPRYGWADRGGRR